MNTMQNKKVDGKQPASREEIQIIKSSEFEEVTQKIHSIFQCLVCMDTCIDPTIIHSCGHTVCFSCINKLTYKAYCDGDLSKCPCCREIFDIKLCKRNFKLEECMDVIVCNYDELKKRKRDEDKEFYHGYEKKKCEEIIIQNSVQQAQQFSNRVVLREVSSQEIRDEQENGILEVFINCRSLNCRQRANVRQGYYYCCRGCAVGIECTCIPIATSSSESDEDEDQDQDQDEDEDEDAVEDSDEDSDKYEDRGEDRGEDEGEDTNYFHVRINDVDF